MKNFQKKKMFLKILYFILMFVIQLINSTNFDVKSDEYISFTNLNKPYRNSKQLKPRINFFKDNLNQHTQNSIKSKNLLVDSLENSAKLQNRRQKIQIKCTYLIVDKNLVGKIENSNTNYFYKIFQIQSGRIDLNLNYFKIHTDNCFDDKIIENIEYLAGNRSVLYGIDLSSNRLDDAKFELVLNNNPLFKYRSNLIKYLNLSDNNLSSLSSSHNSKSSEPVDEFAYLNELNLKTNDSWYFLNRFNNLEALILDKNLQIQMFSYKIINFLMKKLKVFSLNKCNLNENFFLKKNHTEKISISNLNNTKLFYMGLSKNKLGDLTQTELSLLFSMILPSIVDILDLSSNKFTKLDVLFDKRSLNKINMEKNLISSFNINEFLELNSMLTNAFELNLRSNFIRNVKIENFKIVNNKKAHISVKLKSNPLLCDCNSMWLYDEMSKSKAQKTKSVNIIRTNAKLFEFTQNQPNPLQKTATNEIDSNIKIIFKREIEEISLHHSLNDPNLGEYLPRQKRIKFQQLQKQQDSENLDQVWIPSKPESDLVKIVDLELLTCNFVDVQNFQKNSSNLIMGPNKYDSNYDMSDFYHDLVTNNDELMVNFKNQNIKVNSITFKEKLLVNSEHQDYVCLYEDQCNSKECDCCVFQHCHCRSICPRQCRCYFDSTLKQNIIDCSNLNLVDIPNASPIESATDMRLSSNNFQLIKSHSFFGFGSLKYLYLQNNRISYLASDAFDDLRYSLKLLNLENNQLNYLNGDEFQSLSELNIIVLSRNPIKDIDNIFFIGSKYLPNLKLLFLSQTKLPAKKINELSSYAKASTNVTIKYKIFDFDALKNSQTTLIMTKLSSSLTTTSLGLTKSLANFSNETIYSETSLLKWYYFPVGVFITCLILSLTIVIGVIVIARKYDKNDLGKSRLKSKKSLRKNQRETSNCFTKLNNDSISSTSYFAPNNLKNKVTTITNEYEVGDFECDDVDSENSTNIYNAKCCNGTRRTSVFKSCRRAASFDSYDCYNGAGHDLASVSVSRSIEKLTLNVYVYFNIASENDYVSNFLLPCLKRCLTIIPDTKFILKPQLTQFITSFSNNCSPTPSDLYLNDNNKNAYSNNSATALLKNYLNSANSLSANILVLSEDFHGYRPNVGNTLMSLKQKLGESNSTNSHISNDKANCSKTNTTTTSSGEASLNTCYMNAYGNYTNKTSKSSCRQNNSDAEAYKNSFKIFLNLDNVMQAQNEMKYVNNTLNNKLIRKLYETSLKSTLLSNKATNIASAGVSTLIAQNSFQNANDMFSSFAYNEKLQLKLEKYLEYICLKSSTFSNTNFSYVDYSKR